MSRNRRSQNASSATADVASEWREAEQVVFLRQANERLSREMQRLKTQQDVLVDAVYRAARDAATGLYIPKYNPPKLKAKPGHAECAIAVLSDVQLGKVTPSYSSVVAEERVLRYADKIIELTKIQRSDHPVTTARVYVLGDIVEGELIFPHQPWTIDSSLFRQTLVDGPRILIGFLNRLLAEFERVHVVGVIGNHGRLGPKRSPYNPETNMDRMLYHVVKDRMEGVKRLTWNLPFIPNERAAMTVDYPFSKEAAADGKLPEPHGFLVMHGDQIPGSPSHSVATIAKRIYGWASGSIKERFDYVVYGHWHNSRRFRFNRFKVWCNGSTESTNTYAQEQLSEGGGPPEQTLLFCHPVRGVSAEYDVDLS